MRVPVAVFVRWIRRSCSEVIDAYVPCRNGCAPFAILPVPATDQSKVYRITQSRLSGRPPECRNPSLDRLHHPYPAHFTCLCLARKTERSVFSRSPLHRIAAVLKRTMTATYP